MEMLLYLLGNWCIIAAACILIYQIMRAVSQSKDQHSLSEAIKGLQISSDLRIMLMIGSIARVYWSCSPPRIWEHEEVWIQYMSISDIFFSVALWIAIVATFFALETEEAKDPLVKSFPVYVKWYVLTAVALVTSFFGSYFLPHLDDASWPLADTMVVFNMIVDGFAMIPQMYVIANSTEKASGTASHFVGLLCLARVFRMLFWAVLFFVQEYYILAFIVPDVIHSFIMGDYLYLWMKKVKKEQIEPLIKNGLAELV